MQFHVPAFIRIKLQCLKIRQQKASRVLRKLSHNTGRLAGFCNIYIQTSQGISGRVSLIDEE